MMMNRSFVQEKLDQTGYEYEPDQPKSLLASAGLDNRVYVWFPATGDKYREYELDKNSSQVNALRFSSDGKMLAVTGYETLRVFDVHSKNPLSKMRHVFEQTNTSSVRNITCVSFMNADSDSVITGGEDAVCRLWHYQHKDLKLASEVKCEEYGVINCLTTKHPLYTVVVGTQLGYILGLDMKEQTVDVLFSKKGISIQSLDCHGSSDSYILVAVTNSGMLLYFRDNVWIDRRVHENFGLCVVLSHDGQLLATGGSDRTVRLFRIEGHSLREAGVIVDKNLKWIWNLQISHDKAHIFISSSEGVVQMWSRKDCSSDVSVKFCRAYTGHEKSVVSLAYFERASSS